jgi:hypothetical protein
MRRINRHDLYHQLINYSFAGQLLSIAVAVSTAVGGRHVVPDVLQIPYSIIGVSSFVIPIFLIFQRWMRDDFSEALWQRTAGTVLRLLVILPIPIAVAAAVLLSGENTQVIERAARMQNGLDPRVNAHMQGIIRAGVYLWFATPMLFTFVFQWHRWRAGR